MNEGHVVDWNLWNVNATWSESQQRSATRGLPHNLTRSHDLHFHTLDVYTQALNNSGFPPIVKQPVLGDNSDAIYRIVPQMNFQCLGFELLTGNVTA